MYTCVCIPEVTRVQFCYNSLFPPLVAKNRFILFACSILFANSSLPSIPINLFGPETEPSSGQCFLLGTGLSMRLRFCSNKLFNSFKSSVEGPRCWSLVKSMFTMTVNIASLKISENSNTASVLMAGLFSKFR